MLVGVAIGLSSALLLASVLPAISVWPLLSAGGLFAGAIGTYQGGRNAVAAYHQQKHNQRDEANINALDARTQVLEQAAGITPRKNFADAEITRREQTAENGHTIH
ncbi:MAG: hypothetical protein V4735_02755 [Pseudomonadota bacterium]